MNNYCVLARKWRPTTFGEVMGQDPIVRSLINTLRSKKIGHAYLMAGTRGVGKTTVARIFARAIRCENLSPEGNLCGQCPCCREGINDFNIIEIDGASHNSVDEVRALIDNVHYLPTTGTFKVYIVDEVHMLTKSAFNAFLKTLEEPPPHVVFIFATTLPEKLLGTVLSRCQRLDFRHIPLNTLMDHVNNIALKENISFSDDNVLQEICRAGEGSVRDTLSALDQVLCYTTDNVVTEDALTNALGIAKRSCVRALLASIFQGLEGETSRLYRDMVGENIPLENLAQAILSHLFDVIESRDKEEMVKASSLSEEELFWLYQELAQDLSWALTSIDPPRVIEIILRKLAKRRDFLGEEKKKRIRPWGDFLQFVGEKSALMKSNLEKGNVLETPVVDEEGLRVEMVFPLRAHLFLEHLQREQGAVEDFLAEFYRIPKERVSLGMRSIGEKEARERGLRSVDEIMAQEYQKRRHEKRENISCDPLILKAQEIFQTKIDHVAVNETRGR